MPYSPQKMHMHPCMRAYATVQKLLCHGNYCELILSPVRASLKPSSAARPAAGPTKSAARGCPRKTSFQIHVSSRLGRRRSVAQASFNHPRWCRPHSVCLWSHLQLGREGHPFKKSISAIFPREFFLRVFCATIEIWLHISSHFSSFSIFVLDSKTPEMLALVALELFICLFVGALPKTVLLFD